MENILYFSKIFLSSLYVFTLVILCIFGLNRYYLSVIYKRHKDKKNSPEKLFKKLPGVTIQLPTYNEMYVAKRLIESVCEIDYPAELLQIQVLDDSTDSTTSIAKNYVEHQKSRGIDIEYVHRDNRTGFKAGALANGLKTSKGDFIAVFDADFIPPKDFLHKTIHYFTDPKIGIVQTRWGHINRDYSLLTKAQSVLLDGHFAVEQFSRFHGGFFINFNGTAGILRKSCIEDAGGWQHDTLTEDLDLSYRAQMNGWRTAYLDDVVVEAELPADINSFKSQQHRWAKGGIQSAIKLLPSIFARKDIKLKIKIQCALHLLGNISHPMLLFMILLMVPLAYLWKAVDWENVILFNLIAISAGTLTIFKFYLTAVKSVHGEDCKQFIKYIPVAIALGSGLAINNTKAVFEALFGKQTEFNRTPKFAIKKDSQAYIKKNYILSTNITTYVEFSIGCLLFLKTIYAVHLGFYGWVPFLIIIQSGFFYVSTMAIFNTESFKNILNLSFLRRVYLPKLK